MTEAPLLRVENLAVSFQSGDGKTMHAVDGVSFDVKAGRTLGIVGESGCGKSVTSLAIMGLLPPRGTQIEGNVFFEGKNLRKLPPNDLRDLRGNRIAMIFQEPMTSLNPSYTIGDQIMEALLRHKNLSRDEAKAQAIAMLGKVKIPNPDKRFDDYPHRLSGGMRQRVMIAMALACEPDLLIADEPTTALDVTIQAQVLDLLRTLREEAGASVILITHDLGVVAETCDDVAVMYAGQIVEQAPVGELFHFPQHPYTLGLLGSLPRLDERREKLSVIEGTVPDMTNPPVGCRFAARCAFADSNCAAKAPPLVEAGKGRLSRCWKTPLESLVA